MNTNNTNNHNPETQKSSKILDFSKLFFRDIIEDIVDNKTKISHLRPEDRMKGISYKEQVLISDNDILRELLIRRYKKLSDEKIQESIQYLYNNGIEIESLKVLWKNSKSYFSDELEKKGFFHLFDEIFDEEIPYFTKNKKIDELNKELSKKIAKSKEEIFEEEFFDEIYMPEIFNPEEFLENISKLTKEKKKKALEKFYLNYKKQLDTLSSIPEKIKENSKKYDFSSMSDEELIKLLIGDIKEEFLYLSKEQRISTIKKIEIFIDKRKKVLKFMNNPYYKANPKSLLASIYAIPEQKIEGEVLYEDGGTSLVFCVENEETLKSLYNDFAECFSETTDILMGFYTQKSNISDLKGLVSIVNGNNGLADMIKNHEIRHSENKIVMMDLLEEDFLTNAQDEIIAYFKDGHYDFNEIKGRLILKESDNGTYDYYKEYKTNIEYYNEIRKHYEDDLIKALYIAKYMKELDVPNYLEILAIMPVRKWDLLKKIYKKDEINTNPDINLNNRIKIFGELAEIY